MRSFHGNGVQGNRGGLGKQPLSLAKQPLDAGISLRKNQKRRNAFESCAYNGRVRCYRARNRS